MARTAGRAARFFTVKNVTLRRETILIALALLLLAVAIPFASSGSGQSHHSVGA